MVERRYINRIPGQERILVEITLADIPELLEDLRESSLGVNHATATLVDVLQTAVRDFGTDAGEPLDFPEVHRG